MGLRITCVVDNATRSSSQMWAEHGLSFWLQTDSGPILFDTGQSGAVLLHNLDALSLDAGTLKAIAISHAHYDHTGGLPALATRLPYGLPLYANHDLLRERFSQSTGTRRSIGLPVDERWLRERFTLHLDDQPQEILPGVWTTGAITARPHPAGYVPRQEMLAGTEIVPDTYQDDLSLVVESEEGLIVLCGCCHAGLLNTLEHVRRVWRQPIIVIAGGTHLVSASTDALQSIAQTLAGWASLRRIYLNHCSGDNAAFVLRQVLGSDVVQSCPAGTVLE